MVVLERESVVYDERAVMGLANFVAQKYTREQVTGLLGVTEDDLVVAASQLYQAHHRHATVVKCLPEVLDASELDQEARSKEMFHLALLKIEAWRELTSYHRHTR